MIASYVNSLIKTMATRFVPLNVVATGGGYKSIQSLVTSDIEVIDDLILRSLLNYDAKHKTKNLTTLALLCALLMMLALTPLGFLQIGPVRLTFIHLPVIVGGFYLEPKVG
ncbi:ECF transporter S component [Erysipelothrix sp. D19-032]